jgi:hypothetical protein
VPLIRPAPAAVAVALTLAGCGSAPPADRSALRADRPLDGVTAALDREVRRLPGASIAWSTYWTLCWRPRAGAVAYELQMLTCEGATGRIARQRSRCFRLEVAANRNRRSQGYRHERVQLALTAAQLAYRVRAVLEGGAVTSWSDPYPAGEPYRTVRLRQSSRRAGR